MTVFKAGKEEQEMKEKYIQLFVDAFDIPADKVGPGVAMNETEGWDSVGHVEFITELEDAFDIMLETEEIIQLNSYEKGIEILKKHGVEI